ncbi:MAG TPA: response regulator [bacterium]|nr:response regulator [bacterium]
MTTSKTILVVEDDEGLRLVVKKALEAQGYSVIHAEDSVGSNASVRLRGGLVDLLLADINLPGLTGGEYADYLTTINPNLKVLYMSGAASDGLVRLHVRQKKAGFLQKPFTLEELVTAVRRTLEGNPSGPDAV